MNRDKNRGYATIWSRSSVQILRGTPIFQFATKCAMAEPYGAAYMMTYNLVIIPLWYTLLHIYTFFLSLGINTVMLLLCWIQ